MSRINIKNYEIYIVDYIDGTLSPEKDAAFREFLEANPDLSRRINSMANAPVLEVPEGIYFHGKNNLKKDIKKVAVTPGNAETFIIAEMEGDISDSNRDKLSMLKENNEAVRKLSAVYQKVRLIPGQEEFTGKNKLKRKTAKTRSLYVPLAWTAAVAASVMLMIWLLPSELGQQNTEIARHETITKEVNANNLADNERGTRPPENIPENTPEKKQRNPVQEKNIPADQGKRKNTDLKKPQIPSGKVEPTQKTPSKMPVIRINNIKIVQVSTQPVSRENPEIPSTHIYQKAYAASYRKHEMSQTILGNLYGHLNLDERKLPEFDVWNIAQAGVKGFNVLTENNMELDREIDDKGRVTALAIKSENLNFIAPLRFRD